MLSTYIFAIYVHLSFPFSLLILCHSLSNDPLRILSDPSPSQHILSFTLINALRIFISPSPHFLPICVNRAHFSTLPTTNHPIAFLSFPFKISSVFSNPYSFSPSSFLSHIFPSQISFISFLFFSIFLTQYKLVSLFPFLPLPLFLLFLPKGTLVSSFLPRLKTNEAPQRNLQEG